MNKTLTLVKNRIVQSRWLPPFLAVSVVFIPNSLFVIKLLGVLLALVLLYQSIVLDKNPSNRNLLK